MASSPHGSLTTSTLTLIALTVTVCSDFVFRCWYRATDWLTASVVKAASALPKLVHQWCEPVAHSVALVRARAFLQRLMRREMRLTPGWRLCPSI
jgi:hypothetical protein